MLIGDSSIGRFYENDLRCCSLAARGFWLELLIVACNSSRTGYVQNAKGERLGFPEMARLCGCSEEEAQDYLRELVSLGLISVTGGVNSVIPYFPAVVRKSHRNGLRKKDKKARVAYLMKGKHKTAGYVYAMHRSRDDAIKIGSSVQPEVRKKQLEGKYVGQVITLRAHWPVKDMAFAETQLQGLFLDKHIEGEWFALSASDFSVLCDRAKKFCVPTSEASS